jgi:hypothetical protein
MKLSYKSFCVGRLRQEFSRRHIRKGRIWVLGPILSRESYNIATVADGYETLTSEILGRYSSPRLGCGCASDNRMFNKNWGPGLFPSSL